MTEVVFSKQDAVEMIAIAQEAPIPGGARMAQARSELYQRFASFYDTVTADPVPQPATPAPTPRKRRTNAEIAAAASAPVAASDVLA